MKTIFRTLAVFATASTLSLAWATDEDYEDSYGEEEASVEESTTEETSEEEDAELTALAGNKQEEKVFHSLPYCRKVVGQAEVKRPGATDWEPIVEGRFYALGTMYRTQADGELTIKFGREVDVDLKGSASFATLAQPLSEKSRTIVLKSGRVLVRLPRALPDGLFTVTAPGFKTVNAKGNSSYSYEPSPDGDGATTMVRCVTGDLSVQGAHFLINGMKAANEVKIRTSKDQLFTGIYGVSGDCLVELDQGCFLVKDYATGETHQEERKLSWTLSPKTTVRIHRAIPALGEKMAVTIMTFDAAGNMKNRCAFVENTVEVNSGELCASMEKAREQLSTKASEADDTVTEEVDVEVEEEAEDETPAVSEETGASSEETLSDEELDAEFDF